MSKSAAWTIIFVVIFLLSQDFLFWKHPVTLGWLGLPGWIYWFVILQVVLVVALVAFAKTYWKAEEGDQL